MTCVKTGRLLLQPASTALATLLLVLLLEFPRALLPPFLSPCTQTVSGTRGTAARTAGSSRARALSAELLLRVLLVCRHAVSAEVPSHALQDPGSQPKRSYSAANSSSVEQSWPLQQQQLANGILPADPTPHTAGMASHTPMSAMLLCLYLPFLSCRWLFAAITLSVIEAALVFSWLPASTRKILSTHTLRQQHALALASGLHQTCMHNSLSSFCSCGADCAILACKGRPHTSFPLPTANSRPRDTRPSRLPFQLNTAVMAAPLQRC